jgi:hypothetical protein
MNGVGISIDVLKLLATPGAEIAVKFEDPDLLLQSRDLCLGFLQKVICGPRRQLALERGGSLRRRLLLFFYLLFEGSDSRLQLPRRLLVLLLQLLQLLWEIGWLLRADRRTRDEDGDRGAGEPRQHAHVE